MKSIIVEFFVYWHHILDTVPSIFYNVLSKHSPTSLHPWTRNLPNLENSRNLNNQENLPNLENQENQENLPNLDSSQKRTLLKPHFVRRKRSSKVKFLNIFLY